MTTRMTNARIIGTALASKINRKRSVVNCSSVRILKITNPILMAAGNHTLLGFKVFRTFFGSMFIYSASTPSSFSIQKLLNPSPRCNVIFLNCNNSRIAKKLNITAILFGNLLITSSKDNLGSLVSESSR